MLSVFRSLLVSLAVVAVASAQVFGTHAGYMCGCTGEVSAEAVCRVDDCHPGLAHQEGGGSPTDEQERDDHGDEPPAPVQNDHRHSEVREALVVTAAPPVLALPAVVFLELPTAVLTIDARTPVDPLAQRGCREPLGDGSPPMPLLVARTMVMLV